MTDNEIKKAFEIFVNSVGKGFVFANVDIKKDGINEFKHIDLSFDEIFDLINRLKAENERLKSIVLAFTNEVVIDGNGYYIKDLSYEKITYNAKKCLASIKAEAYKEFAERLKEKYKPYVILGSGVAEIEIDNLLKEMAGEDKVQWSKQGECPVTPEQFEAIYNDEVGEDNG